MRHEDDRGKLDVRYDFRISATLAAEIEKLSPYWKGRMHDRMRIEMAKVIHESKFDPSVYLNGS